MNNSLTRFRQIRVYESTNRFYLVGSDEEGSKFGILKIDRDATTELQVYEDEQHYDGAEIDELLKLISISYHNSKDAPPSLTLRMKAVALIGFVRFLAGYYMLLATKASLVSELGYHKIFRVEETCMLYVPRTELTAKANADEQRYLRTFQVVDMCANFYFSYSYDLTHSLQENFKRIHENKNAFFYERRYVWNAFLLKPLIGCGISPRWYLPLIHGCISSKSLSHLGCTVTILLIARRSNRFAGTRFLKRGSDFWGNVANEAETEQIVFDTSISDFEGGRYTSFTQHRGSIPLIWSQDQTKMVAKPQIGLDLSDPYATVPGRHFGELRRKYGTPLIVINLVKRREKRLHESLLGNAYKESIAYLNLFLPTEEQICYLSFDMARHNKVGNVLEKLANIAAFVVRRNGWFQTFRPSYALGGKWVPDMPEEETQEGHQEQADPNNKDACYQQQRGVTRTNCVDCLDRTNTAQFVIGKVALGFQLLALSMVSEPNIDVNCEPVLILEDMYQTQGDTLAMQYAGSQLVHSVKTYKKSAVFQERSRDVIQTLSRYYSSTFSDADKQNAMNLFLGVYRPWATKIPLWELTSDFCLHNQRAQLTLAGCEAYCQWFRQFSVVDPDSYRLTVKKFASTLDEAWAWRDAFAQYYKPWEITSFDHLLLARQKFIKNVASFNAPMPDSGGFSLGKLLGRSVEPEVRMAENQKAINSSSSDISSLKGVVESSDAASESSDSSDESEAWTLLEANRSSPPLAAAETSGVALSDLFPSTQEVYGFQFQEPSARDMQLYTRYAIMSIRAAQKPDGSIFRVSETDIFGAVKPLSDYRIDLNWIPEVPQKSLDMYQKAVACAHYGPVEPSPQDVEVYKQYAQSACLQAS